MSTSAVMNRVRRAAAAALLVLACGGSARLAVTAAVPRATAAATPAAAVACPAGLDLLIAGVRKTVLPCLSDPRHRVTIGVAPGRPAVINVWASWCGPCRREAPLLEAAYRANGDRVQFVGLDSRDERDAALRFLADSGTTYPQAFDTAARFALAVGAVGIPYTLIVDASGTIVYRQIGALTPQALRSGLALVGVTGSAPG